MTIILIIIGILMFMSLILVHEFWHFQASRKLWVKVNEFWIGLPPKICKLWKDKKGTEYTLNLIPLWGFCAIKGDDLTNPKDFLAPDSLNSAKLWKKIIIILGWVFMNFLTARVLFTFLFWHGTQPLGITRNESSTSYLVPSLTFLESKGLVNGSIKSGVLIQEVMPNSLASSLQLQPQTVILSINNQTVSPQDFVSLLSSLSNQPVSLWLENWEIIDFTCPSECKLWIVISPNSDIEIKDIKFWLWWAMLASLYEIKSERVLTFDAFGMLWRSLFSFEKAKMKEAVGALAWPVGVIKMWEIFYQEWGWVAYLAFAGMISLALAIFNVLPIPALDGWRLLWMLIQSAFRLKPEKYAKGEWYVNTLFFYLFLLVWVIIIFKDLVVYWGLPTPF